MVIDYGYLQFSLMLVLIYIIVLDVNDNVFLFFQFFYVVNVLEDVLIGSVVEEVFVVDFDVGFSGMVVYCIFVGNDESIFGIGN